MNKPQSPRRSRGRGSKRSKGSNNAGRGDNRVKGNPKQAFDKYKSLGRDALQSGDRILAEYYFQHADHYQRVINDRYGVTPSNDEAGEDASDDNAAQPAMAQRRGRQRALKSETDSDGDQQPSAGVHRASDEATNSEEAEAKPLSESKPRRRPAMKKAKESGEPTQGDLIKAVEPEAGASDGSKPKPRRRRKTSEASDEVRESAVE